MAFEPVLTKNIHNPAVLTLKGYRDAGGYEGLVKALKMEPAAVTEATQCLIFILRPLLRSSGWLQGQSSLHDPGSGPGVSKV